jgi:hypothetical protein
MRLHRPASYWKLAILLICLASWIYLTWYSFRGRITHQTLLTVAYLVLLIVLFRTNVIESRASDNSVVSVWARLSDIVKGASCMLAGVVWVMLVAFLVPQTSIGLTVVLAPFAGLLLLGAFFMLKGLLKNLQ